MGPNGAGKTSLVRSLIGDVPVVAGKITQPESLSGNFRAAYLSFEQHQHLIIREEKRDESRFFSGRTNRFTTVEDLLQEVQDPSEDVSADFIGVVAKLKINHLLQRGIRALSNGEMRKVQIARMLIKTPQMIILDEPFDGLDQASRQNLARIIRNLMDSTRTVILVTHRQREILPLITHVMAIRDGRVVFQGSREAFFRTRQMEHLYPQIKRDALALPTSANQAQLSSGARSETLIDMKNVTVQYGGTIALNNLNWTVKAGQNWVVLGPNGSGKTTLLNLVSGDNLQGYANDIHLFGKRRGSGETIWEIKERIGVISSEFQIRYRKNVSALEVVLSGFYDSVGLFQTASTEQIEVARKWLTDLGIQNLSDQTFNRLSYGEQRMVLIARAMVKIPQILILDEPNQGLDRANRQRILAAIEVVGRHRFTNLIYITHYPDEIPTCSTHMLQFKLSPDGRFVASQRSLNMPLA